jgi:hypothetical protein
MVGMEIAGILERAERVIGARAGGADPAALGAALLAERELRAWLDASQAHLATMLAAVSSFPEQAIASSSKGSMNQASSVMERAATLESTPAIAAALDRGAVTAGSCRCDHPRRQDIGPCPA